MRALLGVLCVLVVGLVGCKKQGAPLLTPRVTRISVGGLPDSVDPEHDPRLSQLIDAAQSGLRQAGVTVQLQPTAPQRADFQLRLQLQVQAAPSREGKPLRLRALCAGALSLAHGSKSTLLSEEESKGATSVTLELTKFDHVGVTEQDLPGEPTAEQAISLLSRLVEDSAQTLGSELLLLRTDSRELLVRVAKPDGDPALRGAAIQILGRRKERLAIPVLISLIKEGGSRRKQMMQAAPLAADPDPAQAQKQRQQDEVQSLLRDTAIGALIEIGDRSAVRPLLDSVAFVDSVEMGKVVEAAAALGGEDARTYLHFVSQSHPEAAIRDEASAALKRLERKQGEPSPPAAP